MRNHGFVAVPMLFIVFSFAVLTPGAAEQQDGASVVFHTAQNCIACHNQLATPSGNDVSFGIDWRSSIMASAARDPYWHAAVRREVIDHPESQAAIENECAACHMPMARYLAKSSGTKGQVFAHLPIGQAATPLDQLAGDGVSCSLCHQIANDNLGQKTSFTGGFIIAPQPATAPSIFGRFDVEPGRSTIMRSAAGFQPTQAMHLQKSEMCATCHTLITHALGPNGKTIGELSEQIPFTEWEHSEFKGAKNCQSCHMQTVNDPVAISSVLGQPRTPISRHVFTGGNFFMLSMLNRYRAELGVTTPPQELSAAAARTRNFLQSQSATVSINNVSLSNNSLAFDVAVHNLAGHKLPTAYPSRRVWLRITVRDQKNAVVFQSGTVSSNGAIEGNDNDRDAGAFEPHYREISGSDQVQIYESIMADQAGAVTTGLLSGVRFIKDNRLLPRGFDKSTATENVAVYGDAAKDADFTAGSDIVRYVANISSHTGPFEIVADLYYQPIAYRWAQNFRAYDAPETQRFVSYYESMANQSYVVLAGTKSLAR